MSHGHPGGIAGDEIVEQNTTVSAFNWWPPLLLAASLIALGFWGGRMSK